jgi:hypothetical protein
MRLPAVPPACRARNPYLNLDADVADRVIRLSEGEGRRGGAGHSGSAGTWKPGTGH